MPELRRHCPSTPNFWHWGSHKPLLLLILPMLLAHITAPLMGMVDTAVLGHMQGAHFLAGASFASLILTQLYWVCGFIRMSSTGLSAQAKGKGSVTDASQVLYQSVFNALILGLIIFALNEFILQAALSYSTPNALVSDVAYRYFDVRVMGAPAALVNLALVGWMLGQQMAKSVMLIQIGGNVLNILLNLLFVYVFDWSVEGVAGATVIVEYSIVLASLVVVSRRPLARLHPHWLGMSSMRQITSLNSAMLVRNLALQACLIFITFQGMRIGEEAAAVNAILMQFFVLISLGLDAVAFAVEAKVGESKGALNHSKLRFNVRLGVFWSTLFALLYSVFFWVGGHPIIALLTDIEPLKVEAVRYLPLMILMPLIAHWCFCMDGVFIGLTRAQAMQNTMLLGAVCVFFPIWWLTQSMGNEALWVALLTFLGFRGVSLGGYYVYLGHRQRLVD